MTTATRPMPICPRCGTAYLTGEGHRCEPRKPGALLLLLGLTTVVLLLLAAAHWLLNVRGPE